LIREQIFKDPMTAAAAIDRLVHHSVIIELNSASYRIEQAQKTKMIKSTEKTMRPINDLNSRDQLSSCWGSDTHQTANRAMCVICASGIIQSGSALWLPIIKGIVSFYLGAGPQAPGV